jgi:uncharacterized protein (TIGR02145 family)
MKNSIIFCLLAVVAVSAQQKQRVAVLPSVGDLEPQGLIILTDKVREIATKNLPIDNFTILKQDVITKLIGEEELYRSCKEGVCIGDLAKKTNANYGARCDVMKFENSLVLKFELYSIDEDAIFETFTDIDVKDFRGMLATLEKRLPNTFKKVAGVQNKALADGKNKAREQQKQEPTPTRAVAAGQFTDKRDGKTYRKITIGTQTWMAENLNYAADGSKCYGNDSLNCEEYGRLYNWTTAMGIDTSYNNATWSSNDLKHQGACPAGWHLPSSPEWTTLTGYVGGASTAGTKLKSTTGWNYGRRGGKTFEGTDEYGFAALPGGYGKSDGNFYHAGDNSYWWSTTGGGSQFAMSRHLSYIYESITMDSDRKTFLYSVRCVQD